jgi:hypothetical protein
MDGVILGPQILYPVFGGRHMKLVIIAELNNGNLSVKSFLKPGPSIKASLVVGG